MYASLRTKWRFAPAGARGYRKHWALVRRAVDETTAKDDDRATDGTHTNDIKACFATLPHQGGLNAEVENCRGSRISLRGGRSHLGLCAAEPRARVLRVARVHGAPRKARCVGGALRGPDGGDLRAAWHHQRGLLDSAAKRPGTWYHRGEHVHLHSRLSVEGGAGQAAASEGR